MNEAQDRVAEWCRWQAGWCDQLGSALYGELLRRVGGDVEALWPVLSGLAEDRPESAPALRFMGAVHRIVLEGRAPELARFYPSAGGSESGNPWDAFVATLEANAAELT